jgi:hypothetical protein
MLQADATTRTTIPVYVARFDSNSNFPIRIAADPTRPNKNGLYPPRCFARNANTPSVSIRNAIVKGSKYFVEIRNPRPIEDTIPAYSGQQKGHASLGRSATLMPGIVSNPWRHVRLAITIFMD